MVGRFPMRVFVRVARSVALLEGGRRVGALPNAGRDIGCPWNVTQVRVVVGVAVGRWRVSFRLLHCFEVDDGLVGRDYVPFLARRLFCTIVHFAPPAIVSVIVVVSNAEGDRFRRVQMLTRDHHARGSASQVSVGAGLVCVCGVVALHRLLSDVFVVNRQVVARVSVSVVVVPFETTEVPTTLSREGGGGSNLYRAINAKTRANGQVVGAFRL